MLLSTVLLVARRVSNSETVNYNGISPFGWCNFIYIHLWYNHIHVQFGLSLACSNEWNENFPAGTTSTNSVGESESISDSISNTTLVAVV